MNSLDRQIKAKVELDKAEKEAFEDVKNFENFFKFLQGATKGSELANNIYTLPYETDVKDLFQKYLKAKANSEVSNVDEFLNKKYSAKKWAERFGVAGGVLNAREELSKGNLARALIGAVADAGLLILPKIIKGSNLILIAIDVANIIDKATFDTGLFDISGMLKNFYDKKTGSRDGKKIEITDNGILQVTMPNGDVYARPLINSGKYSLFGDGKDDVLFGGNGDDILQGRYGDDLLLGGNVYDTYLATKGDTIKDSDGKGSVHFNGHKLTGGTYDKDRDLYISDDYIEYKLHDDGRLVVSDMGENIVIENFNKDNNDLGIILIDPKDVVVTIHDNQANEGGNGKHSMEFKITLNRALKKDEFLELIINGQRVKFKEGDIEQTYTHTWDGNTIKEEDRKFKVSASVVTDKSIVKAKLAQAGNETIIDYDREFANLNLLVA